MNEIISVKNKIKNTIYKKAKPITIRIPTDKIYYKFIKTGLIGLMHNFFKS